MGKKKKGPAPEPAAGDTLDQILTEIKTAQDQKVPPHDVLHEVSSHLKQEPSLTIPLIEALARIPNAQTAQLLLDMMDKVIDKKIIKSIKRTLYKLRQRGIRWEQRPSDEKPILTAPKPAEPLGYLSPIDSTGSRILVIARPVPMKGLLVVFGIVSDIEGIQQFNVRQFNKKEFKEFIQSNLSSADFPVIEAPGSYCLHLLKESAALSQGLSKALPQGYHEVVDELRDVTWDGPYPLIYQYIKEDEIKGRPHLLKGSVNLHTMMPFSTWHLGGQEVEKYASRITEARNSKIVLRGDQKEARVNAIYTEALEELFPEDRRYLWKRRLEEMAYVMLKTGREEEARAALSSAVDLENPFSPIEPNPFIWNLVLKSIQAMVQTDKKKKEEEKKTSLIVTP
jgi:hypothetical protein